MTPTLSDLRARVAEARGPDRILDRDICIALNYVGVTGASADPAHIPENLRYDPDWDEEDDLIYEFDGREWCTEAEKLTASLDACVALAERVLPGCYWHVERTGPATGEAIVIRPGHADDAASVEAATPALAMLDAILAALEARQQQKETR